MCSPQHLYFNLIRFIKNYTSDDICFQNIILSSSILICEHFVSFSSGFSYCKNLHSKQVLHLTFMLNSGRKYCDPSNICWVHQHKTSLTRCFSVLTIRRQSVIYVSGQRVIAGLNLSQTQYSLQTWTNKTKNAFL